MSTTTASDAAVSRAAAKVAAYRIHNILREHPDGDTVPLVDPTGDEDLTVPREAAVLFQRVLANMAAGQPVTIIPSHAELTTQQAANLLGVSRPYLIGLLDDPANQIEVHMVGTHRRIVAASLRDYQARSRQRQREAADELTALAAEMDLY